MNINNSIHYHYMYSYYTERLVYYFYRKYPNSEEQYYRGKCNEYWDLLCQESINGHLFVIGKTYIVFTRNNIDEWVDDGISIPPYPYK